MCADLLEKLHSRLGYPLTPAGGHFDYLHCSPCGCDLMPQAGSLSDLMTRMLDVKLKTLR